MKRIVSLLIVVLMVFSVYASATELTRNGSDNSTSTKVSLNLDKNYAIVWFSKGANGVSIDKYVLTLKNPDGLLQNTNGNTPTNKIYDVSNDIPVEGLFLNWNIVSKSNVLITLKINSPLKQTDASGESKKIGWTVSWDYSSSTNSAAVAKTIALADSAISSASSSADAYLKDGDIYGEGSSKQIKIVTDNVWDKDKTAEYSADLIAEIKTN